MNTAITILIVNANFNYPANIASILPNVRTAPCLLLVL